MLRIFLAIFFVLHGAVHFLYTGHSAGKFELTPGLTWPDGSWIFSKLLGDGATRGLAAALCVLAGVVFAAGGAGLLLKQGWWRPVAIGAAIFSTILYLLLWNGRLQRLDGQGWIGILINLAILAAILVFKWPQFEF